MTTRAAIGASQRRCALLALLACAWVLGFAVLGLVHALGFLAPPVALLAFLILNRYPGADAIERRARRRPAVARRRPGPQPIRPEAQRSRPRWSLARTMSERGPPAAAASA